MWWWGWWWKNNRNVMVVVFCVTIHEAVLKKKNVESRVDVWSI